MEKLANLQLSFDKQLLDMQEQADLLFQLPQWQVVEYDGVMQLVRIYTFGNFVKAMLFANGVAELAETNNHHPALLIEWGKVTIKWWTHSLGGLHKNDFIMAARCDQLYPIK